MIDNVNLLARCVRVVRLNEKERATLAEIGKGDARFELTAFVDSRELKAHARMSAAELRYEETGGSVGECDEVRMLRGALALKMAQIIEFGWPELRAADPEPDHA